MAMNAVHRAIAQLNKDGYEVDFKHYRMSSNNIPVQYSRKTRWLGDGHLGDPQPTGGITSCTLSSGKISKTAAAYAVTRCKSTEQFCYNQGRSVSLARAIKDLIPSLKLSDKRIYGPLRGAITNETKDYWIRRGLLRGNGGTT